MSSGYRNFQDEEVKPSSGQGGGRQAVNPYNANIVKGGGVNPSSSLYQRSIAGRQKLDVYLKDLWDKGGDEKDVFMAGVNSLMQRGHGYVGAYLDSKNPGRQYTKNEAMAITDQVMTNAGIGEHPGARLTGAGGETDEEKAAAKEKRKSDREARGEASKYGPQMDTGRKAMPVGQQRKLGKRPSTGVPAEPGDREGIGKRDAEGFYKNWQKEYSQKIKEIASAKAAGTITEEEAAQQLQQLKTESIAKAAKENQSRLSQSPQAQQGRAAKRREDRALDKTGTPGEEETGGGAPGEEEEGLPPADHLTIGDKFKELFQGNVKANLPIDSKALEDLVGETIDILGEDYSVDPDQARKIIVSRFNNKNIDGYKLKFGNPPTPAQPPVEEQRAPESAKITPEQTQSVKDKISNVTPEQALELFKKGTLFDLDTIPTTSVPQQGVQEEAPSTSREPKEGGFRKPGQQSLFKKGSLEPITAPGYGPGLKIPENIHDTSTREGRAARMKDLTNAGLSSDAALKQMQKEKDYVPGAKRGSKKRKAGEKTTETGAQPPQQQQPQPPAPEPQQPPAPEQEPPAPQQSQQPTAPGQQAPAPQQPQQQQAKKPGGQGFNRPAQQAPKPGVRRKSTFLDDVARAVQGGVDRFQTGMEKDRAARQAAAQNIKQATQTVSNLLNRVRGGKFSEYEEMSYEEFAQAVRSIIR